MCVDMQTQMRYFVCYLLLCTPYTTPTETRLVCACGPWYSNRIFCVFAGVCSSRWVVNVILHPRAGAQAHLRACVHREEERYPYANGTDGRTAFHRAHSNRAHHKTTTQNTMIVTIVVDPPRSAGSTRICGSVGVLLLLPSAQRSRKRRVCPFVPYTIRCTQTKQIPVEAVLRERSRRRRHRFAETGKLYT